MGENNNKQIMKKLLFTGSNGFLGRNVLPLLNTSYDVKTLDLTNADICANITKTFDIKQSFDIVVHAIGKAHIVPKTQEEVQSFFEVNVEGTKNLCKALEKNSIPKSFVFISTVAVYGCECGQNITETHPLNGTTPYALSKIEAERFLQEWCDVNCVALIILRPSLIAGCNAPGNLGAMVEGIRSGWYLRIGKGNARKSVLMAADIANLVILAEEKSGIYNVCDDTHPSFSELEVLISKQLNQKEPLSIAFWIARVIAFIGDFLGKKAPINSDKLSKITQSLTFSNDKVKKELNWKPLDVLCNYKI